ncbi:MAG: tRNA uridine-5-carboxymethylaminomethyl(34) synthesis GTPase MnmE [Clostridia bacterium]|nr:tRNA uridine-5-carboxymethylaminomethyl(34) synthesis GTPase MnmE [Clostridia bacterium]
MENRTIAAISTPIGVGGIAVIRLSGDRAIEIADKAFVGKDKLCEVDTHTVHYGHIVDNASKKIDEVLVTVMRAPRSYTCEDVVEISTHGGLVSSKGVLKRLIELGAYHAEAGEFTKRAFLNGRIDLSQAEAVIDIINSRTTLARDNALLQSEGSLSERINSIRDRLLKLAASMQVIIDYPDEELEDVTCEDIKVRANEAEKDIDALIMTSENGKIIKEGIKTAIVGKPNVGKSSLLNFLAKEERAIVTDIAGTTRDVIEESVNVDGVMLVLSDTAGIRETDDTVEKIGVEKSIKSIENSDFVIVMLDSTTKPDDEEIKLLEKTKNKKRIVVINKTDIGEGSIVEEIKKITDCEPIEISVKTGEGTQKLIDKIKKLYNIGELSQSDGVIVTNMRHISALTNAKDALKRVQDSIECGMPSDIASIDLNLAIEALGEITGAVVSDDIVSAVFHDFCVGK